MRLYRVSLGLFLILALSTTVSAKATLTMTMWGDQTQKGVFEQLTKEYMKTDPDIESVDITLIPSAQYREKLTVMAAGGTEPDILLIDSFNSKEAFAEGWVMNLEPYLSRGEIDLKDFFEPFWDGVTYSGQRFGLPIWGGGFRTDIYAVNRGLFDETGLKRPEPTLTPAKDAWTISEFTEATKKLTRDTNGDGVTDRWGFVPSRWFSWIYSAGGSILSPDRTHSVLGDIDTANTLQLMADLTSKYKVMSTRQAFLNGQVGVYSLVFASVGGLKTAIEAAGNFDWHLGHQPRDKAGSVGYAKMNVISITKRTKYPEAAWRLVRFLAGARSNEVMVKNYMSAPWLKSIARSAWFLKSNEPPYNMAPNVMGDSRELPLVMNWNSIYTIINQAIAEINSGSIAAQTRLLQASEQINSILAEAAKKGPLF